MSKNKIQFLNQIELKVRDIAGEFIKSCVTTGSGVLEGGNTNFPVSDTNGFKTGDNIYIYDGSVNSKFSVIYSVPDSTHLIITGDHTLIQPGASIKKNDGEQYLDEALAVYSRYRPLERIEKVTVMVPAKIFDLPSATEQEWETGFSTMNYIEYPVDYIPPLLLPEEDFEIFLNDSNEYKIRFGYNIYTAFRMSYNIKHKFSSDNPGIVSAPDSDFYCISNIAAGIYLLALASRWGESINSGISADTVNYDNKTDQYRRLAKELFGQAANWLGIEISELDGRHLEQSPFSTSQNAEPLNSDRRETLFHNY